MRSPAFQRELESFQGHHRTSFSPSRISHSLRLKGLGFGLQCTSTRHRYPSRQDRPSSSSPPLPPKTGRSTRPSFLPWSNSRLRLRSPKIGRTSCCLSERPRRQQLGRKGVRGRRSRARLALADCVSREGWRWGRKGVFGCCGIGMERESGLGLALGESRLRERRVFGSSWCGEYRRSQNEHENFERERRDRLQRDGR